MLHKEPNTHSSHMSDTNQSTPSTSHASLSTPIQSTENQNDGVVRACFATDSRGVLLGTAVVQIHHSGQVYYARALLDSGPEGTFISSI